MEKVGQWAPLVVTIIAWALFFFMWRTFFCRNCSIIHKEHLEHLKRHGDLLERIAAALEGRSKP